MNLLSVSKVTKFYQAQQQCILIYGPQLDDSSSNQEVEMPSITKNLI